jgi:hypothetical protein
LDHFTDIKIATWIGADIFCGQSLNAERTLQRSRLCSIFLRADGYFFEFFDYVFY